jgi:protocatechuate 3,4-dioxygenase, beta subunit
MKAPIIVLLILTFHACGQITSQQQMNPANTQPLKNSCDNPDADISCCFVNMPESVSNIMIITNHDEPGDKLVISGTVYKPDGKTPFPNIILYVYHTDNNGYYSKNGTETGVQKWHGRLHGWCRTDSTGAYTIQTIKPAPYPDNTLPAHIHAAIKPDNGQQYWITDFVFQGDKLIDKKYLLSLVNIGGTGIVSIRKNAENIWTGKRNIILNWLPED